MNDRYLYKAKRTDNGEWAIGFYVIERGNSVEVIGNIFDNPELLEVE